MHRTSHRLGTAANAACRPSARRRGKHNPNPHPHPNQAEEHEREEEMEVMIKWTIVLSLAALAVTYICGYLLELRHIHTS